MADQAVSSLANAGLSVVVARSVPAVEFGAFALAFTVYSLVVAVSQSLGAQVVVIRFSGVTGTPWRLAVSAATGTALAVGLLGATVVLPVAAWLPPPMRDVLLAMAVLLPALTLQDTWRTVFVARGTPRQAFVNDALWALLQACLLGGLVAAGVATVVWFVAGWGIAAVVAAAWGVRQSRVLPSSAVRPFLRDHRDVVGPILATTLASMGATQVAFLLIASTGGIEVVGALRAAQTLLGPLNIVGFALSSFTVPEVVRREMSRRALIRVSLVLSGVLVAVDLAWGCVLLLLPDSVGTFLLGATWPGARAALPGLVVFTALLGAMVGASAVIRALARTSYVFWTGAALGLLLLVLPGTGAAVAGVQGAAWGFAAAALGVVPLSWWLLVRAVRAGASGVPLTASGGAHVD